MCANLDAVRFTFEKALVVVWRLFLEKISIDNI